MTAVLQIDGLPGAPLAAAAAFYGDWLGRVEGLIAGASDDAALVFAPADHTHRAWRLAAIASLARAHAPLRVNAIEGDDAGAIAAACAYLSSAPGVTGQLLKVGAADADVALYPR